MCAVIAVMVLSLAHTQRRRDPGVTFCRSLPCFFEKMQQTRVDAGTNQLWPVVASQSLGMLFPEHASPRIIALAVAALLCLRSNKMNLA